VARKIPRDNAKRASRPNPREDRNRPFDAKANPRGYNPRYKEEEAVANRPRKKVELLPRNIAQENYIDTLTDPDKHIIFAIGPAGTGKTYIATLFALKGYMDGLYEKIIITRPAVSTEEKHGFLPGDINKKMEPWVMPILDVFKEYLPAKKVEAMIENGEIEIAALAYMRGRSFKNAIIIADEMQNSLPGQMKMLLTRIGENCKMIVDGDMAQHDRSFDTNGLRDFVDRLALRGSNGIGVCRFGREDIERHPIITDVLAIYGEE
jgi:phosphate starvation-inducible PhoH-like protein